MAEPRTCRSLCRNPLSSDENKLVRDPPRALTEGNNTLTPSPSVFWAPILAPTPALTPLFTDELFKQFIKTYLEFNQGPSQLLEEYKWPLKAKVSDIYYGKSHIDCYYFCQ